MAMCKIGMHVSPDNMLAKIKQEGSLNRVFSGLGIILFNFRMDEPRVLILGRHHIISSYKEIQHVKKWSKIFYDVFRKLNIQTNRTSTNFLLINFNRVKKTSKQVFYALAKAGILLRQMDVYLIKNSLRVTVGNNKENLKLIIELKKILNV